MTPDRFAKGVATVKKVLIVDDSENIRQTLALTLQFKECDVTEAVNGREGLQKIQEEDFDLVFCDLAMPGMGGEELITRARQELGIRDLPIIVLSAEEREAKNRALTAGATDYLDKPFAPEDVLAMVDKWGKD